MFDAGPLPYEPVEPRRDDKLDIRAKRRDRLKAFGVFSGIAIGAVAGLEMIIGGGFDFMTPAPEVREVAPSSYVAVYREPWSPEARIVPLSSTEPLFAGEPLDVETPGDRLAGGYDDTTAPEAGYPEVSEEEIRRQIDALYRNETAPSYVEASIIYEDAPAIDEPGPDPYVEAEAMVQEALAGYDYAHMDASTAF